MHPRKRDDPHQACVGNFTTPDFSTTLRGTRQIATLGPGSLKIRRKCEEMTAQPPDATGHTMGQMVRSDHWVVSERRDRLGSASHPENSRYRLATHANDLMLLSSSRAQSVKPRSSGLLVIRLHAAWRREQRRANSWECRSAPVRCLVQACQAIRPVFIGEIRKSPGFLRGRTPLGAPPQYAKLAAEANFAVEPAGGFDWPPHLGTNAVGSHRIRGRLSTKPGHALDFRD